MERQELYTQSPAAEAYALIHNHIFLIGIAMIIGTGIVFVRPIYLHVIGEPNNWLFIGMVFPTLDSAGLAFANDPNINISILELRNIFNLMAHALNCITNPINWSMVDINFNSIMNTLTYLSQDEAFHESAFNCIMLLNRCIGNNWSILLHSTCPPVEVLRVCFHGCSNVLTILANDPSCITIMQAMPEYIESVYHVLQ